MKKNNKTNKKARQTLTYKTEETEEFKKFLVVLAVVIVIIVVAFLIGNALLKEEVSEYEYQAGEVSTSVAIVGTMLNKSETEYYVLCYDSTGNDASAYATYASYYTYYGSDPIKIYYLDLSSIFNQDYYVTEDSNPKATKISELKILDGTLIKVKNGKITSYIEGISAIASALAVE